jgi:hypothetical protein
METGDFSVKFPKLQPIPSSQLVMTNTNNAAQRQL